MKSWRTINLGLIGAIVVVGGLLLLGPAQTQLRNFEYFPDMARSARYNTFAPNPNFPDGKTLQPPVPGTVALERLPGTTSGGPESAAPRPGADTANPFAAEDRTALARGQMEFGVYCQPCHGATAAGDGPVVARGYPRPPDLVRGGAATSSDAELFQTISLGAPDMPPYAAQVTVTDRWRIILYLRSLQGAPVQRASAERRP
jgi:mono/diheme cytochrome c family protein